MTRHAAGGSQRMMSVVAPRRWTVVASVLVAATVLVAVSWTWLGPAWEPALVVRDAATDEILYSRDVQVGERFRLEHTHSVTGRLVVETFSVADRTTIAIEELWFDQHGANLPTGPETIDGVRTTYLEEAGAIRVLHHGRELGSLPLVVGSEQVDHVVEFSDGARIHLLDIADRWSQVELGVVSASS